LRRSAVGVLRIVILSDVTSLRWHTVTARPPNAAAANLAPR